MYKYSIFAIGLMIVFQCCNGASTNTAQSTDSGSHTLVLPVVPDSLTEASDRADYLSCHYWDNLDFADSGVVADTMVIEQSLVDFIDLLNHTSGVDASRRAVRELVKRSSVSAGAFDLIYSLTAKYLYETESPMLDEQKYLLFIDEFGQSDAADFARKERMAHIVNEIGRNQPGSVVPDLPLLMNKSQKRSALHELSAGLPALLLVYDQDCDLCIETIDEMLADKRLIEVLEAGKIKVIAVNTSDRTNDRDAPSGWIWASPDTDIDDLIAMRSLPSIYLIGADGNILIKDASYQLISSAIFH